MFLKFITIENFRGIDSLENLEIGNLNTFVGKNDSGKSIILRALNCFFDEKKFDSKDIFKGKAEQEETIIELSFLPSCSIDDLGLDSKGLITIKKIFSLEKGKTKVASFYLANDFKEKTLQDLWNKKEEDLNALMKEMGVEPLRSGRGRKNVSKIGQIKEILAENERADIYHPLEDFLKNIEKAYGIILPEYSLFDAEQDLDIGATNFQSQFKPIISAYFENTKAKTIELEKELEKDLAKEFEEIRKFMSKNVPELKRLNPKTEFDWAKSLKKFDLNLQFNDAAYDVPISHKGTGFKRLLMVAYFEYLRSKERVSNQIFAIEEPETYLHPSAQEDLLESIIKISRSSQFILSTHSPIFAGATAGENTILVTKDGSAISHYYKGDGIIQRIIDELGIKPDYNLLKNAKYLIFVEGRDDIHFLQSACKKLVGKDLEADGIFCAIGGGSSLKNYADLDLFKKLSPTNKYAVFVDGDNGDATKEKEKEKIRLHCEKDGALFCRISKRDIENYCNPEKIKSCYVHDIISREGAESKNPRISEIKALDICISSNTDVEKCLAELGLTDFKGNMNIKVFEAMDKDEWKAADDVLELHGFFEKIYSSIS